METQEASAIPQLSQGADPVSNADPEGGAESGGDGPSYDLVAFNVFESPSIFHPEVGYFAKLLNEYG